MLLDALRTDTSHTNIAVDQALLRIAEPKFGDITEGSVIRVGKPHDKRLREPPEFLLETHVNRKSAELAGHKEELESERETKSKESVRIQGVIAVAEWARNAVVDIRTMKLRLEEVHQLEAEAHRESSQLPDVMREIRQWKERLAAAGDAQQLQQRFEKAVRELENNQLDAKENETALRDARNKLGDALALLKRAQDLEYHAPVQQPCGRGPSACTPPSGGD